MAVREIEWPRDPAALAASLASAAAVSGGWFWLDGEAPGPGGERGLSYLGVTNEIRESRLGAEREFLASLHRRENEVQGWVVALSYEFGVAMMGEDPAADDTPPAFALKASVVLVLDHARGIAELRGPDEAALDEWLAHHHPSLSLAASTAAGSSGRPIDGDDTDLNIHLRWRQSDAEYLAMVEACNAAIREGEAYVLCLTDTAEASAAGVEPLALYLSLRGDSPEMRGAVIVAGERALVSASPERFLSVRGARVATHPMKGTRPRGQTATEDVILAAALASDPKERAENLMIVDLMRNDLSRICEPGTVTAEGLLRVEQHPRVHQLVSTVSGRLRDDAHVFDAIEACFPGGSMTGAPKRRAVQLLAELERGPRGLYSGCFGWIGGERDAELAMTIRSIELRGLGSAEASARIGAGGGVTADSVPRAELAEKHLKAAALLAALGKP